MSRAEREKGARAISGFRRRLPRTPLADAIETLSMAATVCRKCGSLFVYGRSGCFYCSEACARAAAQRAYRRRRNV